MAGGLFKSRKEGDRVEGHTDVHVGRELRPHPSHTLAGGTKTLPGLAFHNQYVLATRFSEMKRDAGSNDSSTDHYHVSRPCHEALILSKQPARISKPDQAGTL
jgi:hypothetical protein